MTNFFNLTLDTTGPASPSISLNSNAQYATAVLVTATIGTADATTTGYQMKIYGDIDLAWAKTNGLVAGTATAVDAASALWITYVTSKQIQLSAGDGTKNVSLQLRDDVYNVSSVVTDSISLDTTRPAVTLTGPDVTKISKQAGKDVASFSFTSDSDFVEYKVKVVTSSGAAENTGTQLGTTNGSTNMASTGTFTASTVINSTIYGADLEAASAGDGSKIIKIFVKDASGNWSI